MPLQLNVRPSVLYRAALTALHGLLGVWALLNIDERWLVAWIFAACLLSLALSLRYARHPAKLLWREDGLWDVSILGRDYQGLTLSPRCLSHPWLVSLAFEGKGGSPGRIVIAPDSLSEDDFRRLRVRLKAQTPLGD